MRVIDMLKKEVEYIEKNLLVGACTLIVFINAFIMVTSPMYHSPCSSAGISIVLNPSIKAVSTPSCFSISDISFLSTFVWPRHHHRRLLAAYMFYQFQVNIGVGQAVASIPGVHVQGDKGLLVFG